MALFGQGLALTFKNAITQKSVREGDIFLRYGSEEFMSLISIADGKLYRAKENGHNFAV